MAALPRTDHRATTLGSPSAPRSQAQRKPHDMAVRSVRIRGNGHGYREARAAHDRIGRRRPVIVLRPAFSQAGFDFVDDGGPDLGSFFGGAEALIVAGICSVSVDRTLPPA